MFKDDLKKKISVRKVKMNHSFLIIAAVVIVGWWFSEGVELFTQATDAAKQSGRISFLKKQFETLQSEITVDRLNAMHTKIDDLDDQTQTLMENVKIAK